MWRKNKMNQDLIDDIKVRAELLHKISDEEQKATKYLRTIFPKILIEILPEITFTLSPYREYVGSVLYVDREEFNNGSLKFLSENLVYTKIKDDPRYKNLCIEFYPTTKELFIKGNIKDIGEFVKKYKVKVSFDKVNEEMLFHKNELTTLVNQKKAAFKYFYDAEGIEVD
jgi:hypothetical protein